MQKSLLEFRFIVESVVEI